MTGAAAAAASASVHTPTFHELEVAEVRELTPDSVEISFAVPRELTDAYAHAPGQHVTVKHVAADGREQRRSYSITTPLGGPGLAIGVRRVTGGRVSEPLTRDLRAGDKVEVMTPAGRFTTTIDPSLGARHFLLVAAGSGITPMLSIARSVLAGEPQSSVTLLYGNRTVDSIMFRSEIDALKDQHVARVSVLHFLSREKRNIDLLDGRIDGDRMLRAGASLFPLATVDKAFICGPGTLPEELRAALIGAGLAPEDVHVELFTPVGGSGPAAGVLSPAASADAAVVATADVIINGLERAVPVRAGERVLDAALRAGLDVPWACTGGVCATCRAHVSNGTVEMVENHALEADEVAAGYALTCQSVPTTSTLRVDYDRV